MDQFKERERGFENKYAHDLEIAFMARIRAHYQAGLWAARLLGKTGEEAEAYAEEVRLTDIKGRGPRAVAERIERDLGGRVEDGEVDSMIATFRRECERELKGDAI